MISIIVPVYNVEQYLEECIQSIVSQSYTDWECILIDDGSKDKSGEICDLWVQKDSRFKVVHQKNQGVSAARNAGINLAKGEHITFIDSDDWIEKEYLKTLYQPIETFKSDIIVTGVIQDYSNGISKIYQPNHSCTFELTSVNIKIFIELNQKYLFFGPTSNLYKTSLLKGHLIYFKEKVSYGEDLLFNYQYLEYVRTITCVNQAHYHYRMIGSGTLSTTIRGNQFDIDYEQWKVLQSFYQRKELWSEEAEIFIYHRLWGIIYDALFLFPKLKNVGINYIKHILSTPEIKQLKQYRDIYSCSNWIKRAILQRQSIVFYLFFKLRKKQ